MATLASTNVIGTALVSRLCQRANEEERRRVDCEHQLTIRLFCTTDFHYLQCYQGCDPAHDAPDDLGSGNSEHPGQTGMPRHNPYTLKPKLSCKRGHNPRTVRKD